MVIAYVPQAEAVPDSGVSENSSPYPIGESFEPPFVFLLLFSICKLPHSEVFVRSVGCERATVP